MSELFSFAEAAAITELSPDVIRTALEKNSVPLSHKHRTGKVFRHQFSFNDMLFLTVLVQFPFPMSKEDKVALQTLVTGKAEARGLWRRKGPELVFQSSEITIVAEYRNIKKRLLKNKAIFQRGKSRIVSSPAILSGTPVFRGTRIPLDHIAELIRKGVAEDQILEDFSRLKPADLAYAKLYSRLGPRPGRPRKPLEIRRKRKAA